MFKSPATVTVLAASMSAGIASFLLPLPSGPEVRVVNTAANPVPVTGAVTIDPAGPITVDGSVEITSTTQVPVQVVNSSPVSVQVREFESWRVKQLVVIPPGSRSGSGDTYVVPPGRRFHLDRISGFGLTDEGVDAWAWVRVDSGSGDPDLVSFRTDTLPERFPISGTVQTRHVTSEEVGVVLNGGDELSVFTSLSDPVNAQDGPVFNFYLWGRLE